jgi:hypothetical protein
VDLPPRILALDLSTRIGWATGRLGEEPDHGVIELPKGGGPAGLGKVYAAAVDALQDLRDTMHFTRIVMEAPLPPQAQTHAHTARVQFGLAACVDLWAYRRDMLCQEASASSARAKVLGRARFGGRDAAKAAVMQWCAAQGWYPATDDAGDALVLLAFAQGYRQQPALGAVA